LRYILQRWISGIGTIAVTVLVVLPFPPKPLSAEPEIGSITAARGTVVVKRPGSEGSLAVSVGTAFKVGDVIETDASSTAQMTLTDDSFMNLGPGSAVRVNQYSFDPKSDRRTAVIRLLKGKARIVIYRIRSRESFFRVDTGRALAIAEGFADFVVMENQDQAELAVLESSLSVRSSFDYIVGEIRLGVNQRSFVKEKAPPSSPAVITPQDRKNYLKDLK